MLSYRTGLPQVDAKDDFDRARRAALVRRALRRRSHPRQLPEDSPRPGRAARLEVIPLAEVVGTVELSRQFDARFRPVSSLLRRRWESLALAHRKGMPLPPIEVRKGPDGYYVVDGRHRVSVARAVGQLEIDAWVS
jgi:hypothetical protein